MGRHRGPSQSRRPPSQRRQRLDGLPRGLNRVHALVLSTPCFFSRCASASVSAFVVCAPARTRPAPPRPASSSECGPPRGGGVPPRTGLRPDAPLPRRLPPRPRHTHPPRARSEVAPLLRSRARTPIRGRSTDVPSRTEGRPHLALAISPNPPSRRSIPLPLRSALPAATAIAPAPSARRRPSPFLSLRDPAPALPAPAPIRPQCTHRARPPTGPITYIPYSPTHHPLLYSTPRGPHSAARAIVS